MAGEQTKTPPCKHNPGVCCKRMMPMDDCTRCGWNPKVNFKRMQKIIPPAKAEKESADDG